MSGAGVRGRSPLAPAPHHFDVSRHEPPTTREEAAALAARFAEPGTRVAFGLIQKKGVTSRDLYWAKKYGLLGYDGKQKKWFLIRKDFPLEQG